MSVLCPIFILNIHPQIRTVRETNVPIDSVPQAVQVVGHLNDTQTNNPTKCDGKVDSLINPLHIMLIRPW